MHRLRGILINGALFLGTSVVCLMLLELGLSLALPHFTNYYPWRPHLKRVFEPDPMYLPGISGPSRFFTNAQGLRGDELSSKDTYRILTVGGSTTECLYLDQDEAWPQIVQRNLNNSLPDDHVWIGNAGKSGIATPENILHVRLIPQEVPSVKLILALVGVNDFIDRLAADVRFQPDLQPVPQIPERLIRAFDVIPRYEDPKLPFYKRTRTWFLLTKVALLYFSRQDLQDEAGEIYKAHREARAHAPGMRSELPDLTSALEEYRYHLHELIQEAKSNHAKIVLMTQPFFWRPDLTPTEESRLWFGWAGDKWGGETTEYYTASAMAKGMIAYNRVLLDVCAEEHIPCLDLASRIPKTTDNFYDDVHFTEKGSRLVSDIVSTFLLTNGIPQQKVPETQ